MFLNDLEFRFFFCGGEEKQRMRRQKVFWHGIYPFFEGEERLGEIFEESKHLLRRRKTERKKEEIIW